HDALVGVGVVGGPAQDAAPVVHPNDACQRARLAADVADQTDRVTDHDRRATELAGSHGDDQALRVTVHSARPPAPIHRGHHGGDGVLVPGSTFATRTGPTPRTHPYVGFVQSGPVAHGGYDKRPGSHRAEEDRDVRAL